ncbi:HAD-IIIA family hydrolase [Cohaesibacter sp. CAU 1516]|uniref:D-glycero-alpha-D-manno-heptose-1,7-bisphosphate 7-phosphatase n=1 Tax=Cohaesibacter sp. CAU 1516 TaxID=2576038 RepID=UPI0010FEB3EC|nr:HAD-IIIA family hydrolase [Cohaesibacter sp. CAU 1516]TLP48524.1 HAD-IIIA family hydrolase [Cohaesibacter sp. CAU 1516]
MTGAPYLIFLDRDGTLIRHIPYLCDPDAVELLPGVRDGLVRLKEAGHLLFLHTNQSGVGRGYFTLEQAIACNERMIELLAFPSSPFEAICVAPEHPDAEPVHRKPSPRFALEMAKRHDATPDQIVYIGDAPSDLLAAQAAGGLGIGVNSGDGPLPDRLKAQGLEAVFPVFDCFGAAVTHILATDLDSTKRDTETP